MSGVRITAIVSSFERPDGLKKSLRSVETQTARGQMEVIVCDDGSRSQELVKFLERYERDRLNVTVIRGEQRPVEFKEVYCTFTELINRAMDLAQGEYLSYLTDGNEWTPGRCEHYAAFLDANPEVFLVWGMVQNVRDGKPLPMPAYGRMRMADIVQRIHWGNFIDHGSVMHGRTHLRWSTDPKSWRFADWLFWQRLLDGGMQFANVPFHGEYFYSDKDSLGRCLVERNEKFKEMYERRFGGAKAEIPEKEEDMADDVKKVEYAKNVGGKIEIVPDPGGGNAEEVPPGGIIKRSRVTTADGALWPAFAPYAEFPEYKPKEPAPPKDKKKGARRRRPTEKKVESPKRKVPFERMRETVESAERKAAEMEVAPGSQKARQKPAKSRGKGSAGKKARKASRGRKKASGRGKRKGK